MEPRADEIDQSEGTLVTNAWGGRSRPWLAPLCTPPDFSLVFSLFQSHGIPRHLENTIMKILSLIFRKKCQTLLCCPPHEGRASLHTRETKREVQATEGSRATGYSRAAAASEPSVGSFPNKNRPDSLAGGPRRGATEATLLLRSHHGRREDHPPKKAAPSKYKES